MAIESPGDVAGSPPITLIPPGAGGVKSPIEKSKVKWSTCGLPTTLNCVMLPIGTSTVCAST